MQVSSVLINLWACAHAFRSRSALPQFIPSPRIPLAELMASVDTHARNRPQQTDLAILYAMAENEALAEVCDILEEVSRSC
jgi:F0F1-type ATP synthase delta subunit